MPSIAQGALVKAEVEAMEIKAKVNTDSNQKADHQAAVQIVARVTLQRGAWHSEKECYYCHKKGHFSQYCRSKQHGCSQSQSKYNGSSHTMMFMM